MPSASDHTRAASTSDAASPRGPRRGFFDAWSRIYDFGFVQWATYRPVHDAVLRNLRAHSPASVLDLGCGTGQLLRRLADDLSSCRLAGCDFSAGMLQHAAERLSGARRTPGLVRGDAMRLPFRDATFDAIVSTEAFHWFPDQHAAIAEIARVLVPNGVLLLGFVNPPLAIVSEAVHIASRLFGAPLHWPTARALRRTLTHGGFDVVSQRRIYRIPGFLVPPVLTEARKR